jgi:(p)ppGpp synthase/HD superfamily hydrolase
LLRSTYQDRIDFSRSDDFITMERDNRYSALQDTLRLAEGDLEIAITTEQRESINNWGLVSLMRQGTPDLVQYALKLVFTPREEVYFLPPKATGNDFAATINLELLLNGHHLWVDDEQQPMSMVIPNGAKVRIETGDNPRQFTQDDLSHCVMQKTRILIEQQLRRQDWDQVVTAGRSRLEPALNQEGLFNLDDLQEIDSKAIRELCSYFGCEQVEDLYFRIGREEAGMVNRVIRQMHDMGLTKQQLNLTSLRLKGINQTGVLASVCNTIADHKGNILTVKTQFDAQDYELRMLVTDLTRDKETAIKQTLLASDFQFTEVSVV